MLLNGLEFALMNNPVRRFMQSVSNLRACSEWEVRSPEAARSTWGAGRGRAPRLSWTASGPPPSRRSISTRA
jgi:hypothetical protein